MSNPYGWSPAIRAALRPEKSGRDLTPLCEMLRSGAPLPPEVRELVAWLLEEKSPHRPPLPDGLREAALMAKNERLYVAETRVMNERQAILWRGPGKLPLKPLVEKFAREFGVSSTALLNRIKHRGK